MTPLARRLWTLLPPLVVLGGLAAVLLRATRGTDARDRAEASIRTRWDAPAEVASVRRDLAAYYDHYGAEPEGRWFAIAAYARIGDTASAFDVWNRKPEAAHEAGSVHRLADVLLHALGQVPGAPDQPSFHLPRVLQALTEGGDAVAEERLRAEGRRVPAPDVLPLYAAIHRSQTKATRVLAQALLENPGSLEATTAGAVMASGPKDRSHVAFLVARMRSSWKFERLFMWQHIARALGAAGGAEAVEALRAEWTATTGAVEPEKIQQEQIRRMGLDAGLTLTGDATARSRLFASFVRTQQEMAGVQLALGWTIRRREGDPDAVRSLVDLWGRAPGPVTRLQIAVCSFLSDDVPPAEMPCDTWADDLTHESGMLPRALAHVWRLRRGVPGAVDDTVHDFDVAVHVADLARAQEPEADHTSTAMEILRAWYRWGAAR